MKKIFLVLGMALIAGNASAAEVKIFDLVSKHGVEVKKATFHNGHDTCASVELVTVGPNLPTYGGEDVHHIHVAGLSFDSAAAQVVFAGKNGKVVCATAVRHGFKDTGACTFSVRKNDGVYFVVAE